MMEFPVPQSCMKLRIDSRLDQVFMVGHAIRGICSHLGLDKVVVYKLELAVVEAVNNAIKHAYESRPGYPVEITVGLSRECLRFEICDEGNTLNFQRGACLDYDPRDRKTLPERGMGLTIMEEIMDEISYGRREGRNCLTLCKHLTRRRSLHE